MKGQFPEGTPIPNDLSKHKNVQQVYDELGSAAQLANKISIGDVINYNEYGTNQLTLSDLSVTLSNTTKGIENLDKAIIANEGNPDIVAKLKDEKRSAQR